MRSRRGTRAGAAAPFASAIFAPALFASMLLALATAAPAGAESLTIVLGRPHFTGDSLAIDWRITSLLDDAARRSLESGVGADLVITLEVWRKRRLWFSKVEASRVFEYSALFDERSRRFELLERGGGKRAFSSVGDLEQFLAAPAAVAIAAGSTLSPTSRYFIAITVELKPLTLEAMRRIEWWMSGSPAPKDEDEDGGGAPGSGLTGRLIGIAADLSGFGDRTGSDKTEAFRIAEIGRADAGGRIRPREAPRTISSDLRRATASQRAAAR